MRMSSHSPYSTNLSLCKLPKKKRSTISYIFIYLWWLICPDEGGPTPKNGIPFRTAGPSTNLTIFNNNQQYHRQTIKHSKPILWSLFQEIKTEIPFPIKILIVATNHNRIIKKKPFLKISYIALSLKALITQHA